MPMKVRVCSGTVLGVPHRADHRRALGQRRRQDVRGEFLVLKLSRKTAGRASMSADGQSLVELFRVVAAGEGGRLDAARDHADGLDEQSLAGACAAVDWGHRQRKPGARSSDCLHTAVRRAEEASSAPPSTRRAACCCSHSTSGTGTSVMVWLLAAPPSPASWQCLHRQIDVDRPAGDKDVPDARAVEQISLGDDDVRHASLLDRAEAIACAREPRGIHGQRLQGRRLRPARLP